MGSAARHRHGKGQGMRLRAAYTLHERASKSGARRHLGTTRTACAIRKAPGQLVKPTLKDRGRVYAAREALRIVNTAPRKIPTLRDYAGKFFDWERSTYIRRLHAKGRSFNRHWAQELHGLLSKYVFPRFGAARLDAITRPGVENWLVDLELSNQSKNHLLARPARDLPRGRERTPDRPQPAGERRADGEAGAQAGHLQPARAPTAVPARSRRAGQGLGAAEVRGAVRHVGHDRGPRRGGQGAPVEARQAVGLARGRAGGQDRWHDRSAEEARAHRGAPGW